MIYAQTLMIVASKSVYSDATDPYYLLTAAELLKVLNKTLDTNTIWNFALQQSWFNQDHESKEFKVFVLVKDLIKNG